MMGPERSTIISERIESWCQMPELTHFDESGASRMVDVSAKPATVRVAKASGLVRMLPGTLEQIRAGQLGKGDVFGVARLAGIMAAKRTGELIPLCHPLGIDAISIHIEAFGHDRVRVESEVRNTGRTGIEMEALTAVSVSCLTIYDMCKAIDRSMVIEQVRLEEKSGGQSGDYRRGESTENQS